MFLLTSRNHPSLPSGDGWSRRAPYDDDEQQPLVSKDQVLFFDVMSVTPGFKTVMDAIHVWVARKSIFSCF